MNLSIGTNVIYGTNGICCITDKREEDFGTGKRMYYVLRPVGQRNNADIYIPEDSEALMKRIRQILSPEEIYSLIEIMPDENMDWIEDNRTRGSAFEQIISGGDRRELVRMSKVIYAKKRELSKEGKKLGIADERLMRAAEKMLFEEFASVLDIKQEEVLPFITKQIKCGKKYREAE